MVGTPPYHQLQPPTTSSPSCCCPQAQLCCDSASSPSSPPQEHHTALKGPPTQHGAQGHLHCGESHAACKVFSDWLLCLFPEPARAWQPITPPGSPPGVSPQGRRPARNGGRRTPRASGGWGRPQLPSLAPLLLENLGPSPALSSLHFSSRWGSRGVTAACEELPGGSAAATLSQCLLMKRFSLGLFPLGINGGVRNSTFIWKRVSVSCSRAQQNKWYDMSASNAAAHCGVKPHLPVLLACPVPPSAAGTRVQQSTAGQQDRHGGLQ